MLKTLAVSLAAMLPAAPAFAAELTYRTDIAPIFQAKCSACHGAQSPYLGEFLENEKKFREQMKGPRMDSYSDVLTFIGWPDTGAIMRRLDDGANSADRKPGNMYQFLGASDEERQKNLSLIKAWIGEDAWNLKRWEKRGDVPAVTKEEMNKIKAKY
jgi:hypothetical protein